MKLEHKGTTNMHLSFLYVCTCKCSPNFYGTLVIVWHCFACFYIRNEKYFHHRLFKNTVSYPLIQSPTTFLFPFAIPFVTPLPFSSFYHKRLFEKGYWLKYIYVHIFKMIIYMVGYLKQMVKRY